MGKTIKKRAVMGRPLSHIDWDKVAKLANIFCPCEDIAQIMEVSLDTLERASRRVHKMTFAEWCDKNRATGRRVLRQLQLKMAMEGSIAMAIFLGKNQLGQSDNNHVRFSGDANNPVVVQAVKAMTPEERLETLERLRAKRIKAPKS